MYLKLYKSENKRSQNTEFVLPSPEFTLVEFKPKLSKLSYDGTNKILNLIWYIISKGQFTIIYILKNEKTIHTSYIIPKNLRFPFMNHGDLQIGPCYTSSQFRGKGIYTQVLRYILNNYLTAEKTIWIYTTFENIPSQKAIERAGFIFSGQISRNGLFKIMTLVTN
jgi:hypothetical protein